MYIPLDRLYHFIEKTACQIYGDAVIIYRFWPHGSKNIQDLNPLSTYCDCWAETKIMPYVWCNDQEPLAYEFYSQQKYPFAETEWTDLMKSLDLFSSPQNLNWAKNVFQKNILLHSEKRSQNVEKYISANELLPVYYWSHAVIARDWFRYAKHANFEKNISKRFLIYNRAWSGTREYRLAFSELLIEHELVDHCRTFFNAVDNGKHYQKHMFENPVWRPKHKLENYFQPSLVNSCASSDFDEKDYQSTEIEVVLETLFDDDRLHLTEKSLRPIACRQPFILAAPHGSLQYLRDYGFQTFDTVWDENYDLIQDPGSRMQAIIKVMRDILAWSDTQHQVNTQRLQQIANHNQKHFFSEGFAYQVIDELGSNMGRAFDKIKQDPGFDVWAQRWQHYLQFPEMQDFLSSNKDLLHPTKHQYDKILDFFKQYPKTVAKANKI